MQLKPISWIAYKYYLKYRLEIYENIVIITIAATVYHYYYSNVVMIKRCPE